MKVEYFSQAIFILFQDIKDSVLGGWRTCGGRHVSAHKSAKTLFVCLFFSFGRGLSVHMSQTSCSYIPRSAYQMIMCIMIWSWDGGRARP